MAEQIVKTNNIQIVEASAFKNTDTIFVLVNDSLRRMTRSQFVSLLNSSVKGAKGDTGLTGNRGEKGSKGDKGDKGDDAVINVVTQAQYDALADKSGVYFIEG